MLPILDPNRNNNRPARVPVNHVMAALLWAQLLMPRRDFDRFMQGIQATAATTAGYISYKIINSIASVLPGIYDYIKLSEEGKLTKNGPENQEEADMLVKSIKDTAESNKRSADTTKSETSVSKKPRSDNSDFVTPDRPAKRQKVTEFGISPDGTLLKAPPGTRSSTRLALSERLAMSNPEPMDQSGSSNNSADPRLQSNEVTKISRFPYAYEGIPKQYTTILPLNYQFGSVSVASTNSVYYIRMESIYDCIKSDNNTYSADPVVAADIADAGIKETPYWRDYWTKFWEYWTVVETRWKIRAWSAELNNNKGGVMYVGYTGIQKVPIQNALTPATRLTERDYDRFKTFKKYYIKPKNEVMGGAGTQQYELENMVTLNGVYHKGDGVHEVGEDELVQTWIKGDNVPKEQNNLTIVLTSPQATNIGGTSSLLVEIDIEYVVQFKDLKAIYQFPTPGAFPEFYQKIA